MYNVLVTDPIHPEALALLKKEGFNVTVAENLSKKELQKCIGQYEALIARTSTKLPAEVLAHADNLRCIGVHATGWDHIDTKVAKEKGIALVGFPSSAENFEEDCIRGSFIPAAEHVILCMLAVAGNFYEACKSMKNKKWEKYHLVGTELYGKTLGIIGLGRIGTLVASRAKAFGMKVLAYHHTLDAAAVKKRGATLATLSEIYETSDYITVHIPTRQENVDFIDREAFRQMKPGVVFINTARAAVVNEDALIEALESGKIKMAVLDVFDNAPDGVNWELVQKNNVLATPHIAGVSHESLRRVSDHVVRNVIQYLKEGSALGLITV